jgi:hypothetical protein
VDKVGEGVLCPYSFDHPYVLEFDQQWQPPAELADALQDPKLVNK